MSEPSHTKKDGDHLIDLGQPRDTVHDHELVESTEVEDTKATQHAHTNDRPLPNTALTTPPSPATKPKSKPYTNPEKQKIHSLIAKNKDLASKQTDISQQHTDILASLRTPDPKALVGRHISLLHEYNEIRDSGQKLMAMIAEERGVTAKEVYEEFGVGESD